MTREQQAQAQQVFQNFWLKMVKNPERITHTADYCAMLGQSCATCLIVWPNGQNCFGDGLVRLYDDAVESYEWACAREDKNEATIALTRASQIAREIAALPWREE